MTPPMLVGSSQVNTVIDIGSSASVDVRESKLQCMEGVKEYLSEATHVPLDI